MTHIYDLMEKKEKVLIGSGESVVITPDIQIPFNITAGAAPLPENEDLLLAAKTGGKYFII